MKLNLTTIGIVAGAVAVGVVLYKRNQGGASKWRTLPNFGTDGKPYMLTRQTDNIQQDLGLIYV